MKGTKNIKDLLDSEAFIKKVKRNGWYKVSMGRTSSIIYDERFTLLVRKRGLHRVILERKNGEISKNTKQEKTKTIENKGSLNDVKKERIFNEKSTECQETASTAVETKGKKLKVLDTRRFKNLYEYEKTCKKYEKGEKIKKSRNEKRKKALKQRILRMMSKSPMGEQRAFSTSSSSDVFPSLSHFDDFESLRQIKSNRSSLVIALDTEFYYPVDSGSSRSILSWQFALVDDDGFLWEFIFFKRLQYVLQLHIALGCIFDFLNKKYYDLDKFRRYDVLGDIDPITGKREILSFSNRADAFAIAKDTGAFFDDKKQMHHHIDWTDIAYENVTLLCHSGLADVTALYESKDLLNKCSNIQGGLVSITSFLTKRSPKSLHHGINHHTYIYPIRLSIRDTMCHAPIGKKKLVDLGQIIGYQKIDLSVAVKSKMDQLLLDDPCLFVEYASNDSVVTLLYAASLYGYNSEMMITLTSATTHVVKNIMMDYFGCSNHAQFERVYRGVKNISHGSVPREGRPGYIKSVSKEAISHDANVIQKIASDAYHGGYNSAPIVGYYNFWTFDYDLMDAYPTAMCLVPDVDWEDPIFTAIEDQDLSLKYFTAPGVGISPLIMMFAFVDFEFPESVDYPCIPIVYDGRLLYPRSSDGLKGVYACGPELFLAVKLGAKVHIQRGYVLRPLLRSDGTESHSVAVAVKKIVEDRHTAQQRFGKKSPEDLLLKTMVNSIYGKSAQNIVPKHHWSAVSQEMKDMGCSVISNPVLAAFTTSIVRALLLAAQKECTDLGYKTFSVTTDGFISDIPLDKLVDLELCGFRKEIEKARLFLTNEKDPGLWSKKHSQNDLLNICTRGNVSLLSGGVCAHNSYRTGYEPDSYDDRLDMMTKVLEREGPLKYSMDAWPTFKDLCLGDCFKVKSEDKKISMDYDMKRKPVQSTLLSVYPVINGKKYETANFSTVPFQSVDEHKKYHEQKKSEHVLRTKSHWSLFFAKVCDKGHHKITDLEWSKLISCVIGHRCGLFYIPMLDQLKGKERIEWINFFNRSKKEFTLQSWGNAGRRGKETSMLDYCLIEGLLNRMIKNEIETVSVDYDLEKFGGK